MGGIRNAALRNPCHLVVALTFGASGVLFDVP